MENARNHVTCTKKIVMFAELLLIYFLTHDVSFRFG